jgi:hypothetical protein
MMARAPGRSIGSFAGPHVHERFVGGRNRASHPTRVV